LPVICNHFIKSISYQSTSFEYKRLALLDATIDKMLDSRHAGGKDDEDEAMT
jgi:hypothetical protein